MQFVVFALLTTLFYALAGVILAGADTSGFRGVYSETIGPMGMAIVIVIGFGLGLYFRYRDIEERQHWHTAIFALPFTVLAAFLVVAAL
mgnify:CR=1 FL=1